jgi:hypothetical protein
MSEKPRDISPPPDDYLTEVSDGTVRHRYLYIGGPLEAPDDHRELFFAIGKFAAAWARMEQHMDAILVQVNKAGHSGPELKLFDPDHPRPFSAKLKLLRRYFSRHPALKRYHATVEDFAGGITKAGEMRNTMMHGVLEAYDAGTRRLVVNGVKYIKRDGNFRNRQTDMDIDALHELAHLTNVGHYMLCDISKELFTPEGIASLRR